MLSVIMVSVVVLNVVASISGNKILTQKIKNPKLPKNPNLFLKINYFVADVKTKLHLHARFPSFCIKTHISNVSRRKSDLENERVNRP
jgi:hypothetical protein